MSWINFYLIILIYNFSNNWVYKSYKVTQINNNLWELSLNNYKNIIFTTNWVFGNQTFNFLWDLGSSNIVLNSIFCRLPICKINKYYNFNKSIKNIPKLNKSKNIYYQTCIIEGILCHDSIKIKNVILNNFKFYLIKSFKGNFFNRIKYQGILGWNKDNKNNFFTSILRSNHTNFNKLLINFDFINNFKNPKLYIGDIQQTNLNLEKMIYFDNTKNTNNFWTIIIDKFTINSFLLNKNKLYCIIDTGSPGIYGNKKSIKLLKSWIKKQNRLLKVTLEIKGKLFNLKWQYKSLSKLIFINNTLKNNELIWGNIILRNFIIYLNFTLEKKIIGITNYI